MPLDVGLEVPPPERACQDAKCPFHGSLRVRGQVLRGRVVAARMQGTVLVQREFLRYLPKYERYEKRRSKHAAHNPPCVAAQAGDEVTIAECRPLSKTTHFVVVAAKRGALELRGEDYTEAIRRERAAAKEREAGEGERAARGAREGGERA